MNYLTNAGAMLLDIAFGALVVLFVLRLLAEAFRADFHNPICQFLYRFTNPVLRPVRKLLPTVRRVNTGALPYTGWPTVNSPMPSAMSPKPAIVPEKSLPGVAGSETASRQSGPSPSGNL